jgi:hypothetical protein
MEQKPKSKPQQPAIPSAMAVWAKTCILMQAGTAAERHTLLQECCQELVAWNANMALPTRGPTMTFIGVLSSEGYPTNQCRNLAMSYIKDAAVRFVAFEFSKT